MSTYSVTVRNLTKKFKQFIAVDDISFDIYKGEIFGFLGANGAGKTTTIRMLCGLLLPSAGEGRVGDYDIMSESEKIKQNIGYMSQKFSLYNDLTIHENIRFFGGVYNLSDNQLKDAEAKILEQMHLQDWRNRLTGSLPLGWKQRLALGCAVIHDPAIIFLDEPTGGVDPISRREFWEFIYRLAAGGKTIFVTTHYMDEAEYCNRLSIMYEGKIIALDTPTRLKMQYHFEKIEDIFIHLVERGTSN
jgi:ABC-2 type transport system ATP-binding protein